ncbi:MAG: hypothetical protein AAAB19_21660 [Rhizobium sp.]
MTRNGTMGRAWLRKDCDQSGSCGDPVEPAGQGGGHRLARSGSGAGYGERADAFASTVSTGEPPLSGLDDAIANMKAVDVLIRSAGTGGWETF